MNRIIILAGGLGNQLFQLSAAQQIFNDKNYNIYTQKLHTYSTKRNPLSINLTGKEEHIIEPTWFKKTILNSKIFGILFKSPLQYIFSFCFNTSILTGYFQNCEKYYKGIMKVKKLIETKNSHKAISLYNKLELSKDSVAIHIRLGDYLKDNTFWHISHQYVNESLLPFSDIDKLVVFCEDEVPNEFKNQLNNYSSSIIYSNNLKLSDSEEFLLMSTFSKLIISNSTFSFWASLINPMSTKKIIYGPDRLYNSKSNHQWRKNCRIFNIQLIKC